MINVFNTLQHSTIEKKSELLPKSKPFIDDYNCRDISYPSGKDD